MNIFLNKIEFERPLINYVSLCRKLLLYFSPTTLKYLDFNKEDCIKIGFVDKLRKEIYIVKSNDKNGYYFKKSGKGLYLNTSHILSRKYDYPNKLSIDIVKENNIDIIILNRQIEQP